VTVTGFLERALSYFADHGIVAKRLMTDNAWIYVKSRVVAQLLARHQLRHLTTKPYRPRTNGKVERFHQTMAREWAYGLVYSSHRERAAALPHWLNHYNTAAPPQLPRRTTPDQPRSQRPGAGQVEAVTGRARLVTALERHRQRLQPLDHLLAAAAEASAPQLAAADVDRRGMRRAGVDIQTHVRHRFQHGRTSFAWGQPEPVSGQTNPRTREVSGLQPPAATQTP